MINIITQRPSSILTEVTTPQKREKEDLVSPDPLLPQCVAFPQDVSLLTQWYHHIPKHHSSKSGVPV